MVLCRTSSFSTCNINWQNSFCYFCFVTVIVAGGNIIALIYKLTALSAEESLAYIMYCIVICINNKIE